jgi:hypothetical protein
VDPSIAAELIGSADQEHARSLGQQAAGHHEAVTPVVAAATQDDRPSLRVAAVYLSGDRTPGVLHEHRARQATDLDGAPVGAPHLVGGQDGAHTLLPSRH